MMKLFKALATPFIGLYKIIDKFIIEPISKFIYFLYNRFHIKQGWFEKILNRSHALIYVSLAFAVGMFFYVDNRAQTLIENEADVIENQPLIVIYNEEAFVVEGIPKTVGITLIGRRSDLYLAKQLGNHKITLDLSNYEIGQHKVKLKYNHAVETVQYKLDPSSVTVRISEKVSTSKSLTFDVLNQDKIDPKLAIQNVTLESDSVVIKGSESTLNKVATIKALVDVNNGDLVKAGTFKIEDIPLVAYDDNGKIINNVEIVPSKITADVVVTSYSVEVPIKVVTTGTATTGYAVSELTSSVIKVSLYGEQSVLSNIQYIEAIVDISNLSNNKTFNVSLSKPNGVRYMSETATTVTVSIQSEATIEVESVAITMRNLDDRYIASAASVEETKVTVIVKGVRSVLNTIEANNITAYVDLAGLSVGTHNVPVLVEGEDVKVSYTSKVKTITVIIKTK